MIVLPALCEKNQTYQQAFANLVFMNYDYDPLKVKTYPNYSYESTDIKLIFLWLLYGFHKDLIISIFCYSLDNGPHDKYRSSWSS